MNKTISAFVLGILLTASAHAGNYYVCTYNVTKNFLDMSGKIVFYDVLESKNKTIDQSDFFGSGIHSKCAMNSINKKYEETGARKPSKLSWVVDYKVQFEDGKKQTEQKIFLNEPASIDPEANFLDRYTCSYSCTETTGNFLQKWWTND